MTIRYLQLRPTSNIWYNTAFPHIVSAETILFWIWKLWQIKIVAAIFQFLLNKLNSSCENYSREETIQGRKLYEERRYISFVCYLSKILLCTNISTLSEKSKTKGKLSIMDRRPSSTMFIGSRFIVWWCFAVKEKIFL